MPILTVTRAEADEAGTQQGASPLLHPGQDAFSVQPGGTLPPTSLAGGVTGAWEPKRMSRSDTLTGSPRGHSGGLDGATWKPDTVD